MFNFFKNFTIIIIFISLLNCAGSKAKLKIAEYNNGFIYLKEAVEEFNNLSKTSKEQLNNEDGYYRFIRKIALEKIVLDNAYKANLDRDQYVIDMIEKAKKETAFEILKKKNIVDKIVVGKDDYKKYKKRYELYQIVKRKDILDQSKIEESKKTLEKLSNEINDLSTFIEKVKEYSDDLNTSSDGYVGKVSLGVFEDVIDDEIKKMKIGDVSKVIESSMAFHLFFLNDIEEIEDEELYKNDDLFEMIYREKRAKLEEEWYKKLLKDKDLKIYENKIKDEIYDSQTIVEYKDKSITREQFFKVVDSYKQFLLPEPTEDDLKKLLEDMGLELILSYKSNNKAIYDSKDYKEKIKFLLINTYIDRNIIMPEITEEAIKAFYDKNIKTLFTFHLDDGKVFIQPLDEVNKMIIQRIEEDNVSKARYNLYRKLVEDSKLKINEEFFNEFKKRIKI